MKIRINTYRRKDGHLMCYVNRSNGVSVGLSSYSTRNQIRTKGEDNAIQAAANCLDARAVTPTIPVNYADHVEPKYETGLNYFKSVLLTDVATLGAGHRTGSDGQFALLADGRVCQIGYWMSEDGIEGDEI